MHSLPADLGASSGEFENVFKQRPECVHPVAIGTPVDLGWPIPRPPSPRPRRGNQRWRTGWLARAGTESPN